jgi:Flp pilus assembly protein TadD
MEQGRLDEAENYLQRVAMITAMTPSLHNHMGELAMKRLNYDTAKGHFQSAIRLEDWNPIYYWNLALSYELGGDCESGLKTWTQYLQVEFSIEDKQKVESHLRENYYSREGKCHQ